MILNPRTQTWVTVRTDTTGVVTVEPYKKLVDKQTCLLVNGKADSEREKTFWILVANFREIDKRLLTGQAVARAVPYPSNITEADICHGELHGLVDEKTSILYRKRIINSIATSVVNEYIRENCNSHMA